jgi:hypothetical protein
MDSFTFTGEQIRLERTATPKQGSNHLKTLASSTESESSYQLDEDKGGNVPVPSDCPYNFLPLRCYDLLFDLKNA